MQSPFILESTLKKYFNNNKSIYPELIKNTRNDIHVYEKKSKQNSIELFAKGSFNLLKWHSNICHH